MKESTKIRAKALGLLALLVFGSPFFFLLAGIHEQFFAEDRLAPQGKFLWGVKIMAATYVEVVPELWNEFKFGVEILEDY